MLKLNRKLFLTISVATAALFISGCAESEIVSKPSIDGGVYYPVSNGKTSVYAVNEDTLKGGYKYGRVPTPNELKAWNTDVMPDGTGLPEGEGTAEEGGEIYEAKCIMCHGDFGSGGGGYPSLSKGNAYDLQKTLTNQRVDGNDEGPVRVFGSYWPQASTLWWYIKDGMPHATPGSLTDHEVYSLVAFVLNINEFEIDGVEVDDEYVLNREKFLKIKMPNRNGFEPNIDGPTALHDIREYYRKPSNFGAIKVNPADRCMTDCQKPTAKVTYIKNGGINAFEPPMNTKRDLPAAPASKGFNAKKAYADNCAMCHSMDGMGAPLIGDKAGWSTYVKEGMKTVYKKGIKGINGMPPKGGASLSDSDFKAVVDYIISQNK